MLNNVKMLKFLWKIKNLKFYGCYNVKKKVKKLALNSKRVKHV